MEVNEKLTQKIADLARLKLTDTELAEFTPQLNEVMKYVAQLDEVDVEGVEPLTHAVEFETPYREDVARPPEKDEEGKSKVLSSAPELLYDGYKVPQII